MGYCGIKIQGHSETDFKHRTAFKTRKTIVDIENTSDIVVNTSRIYRYDSKKARWMRIVSFILVIFFISLTYFAGKNIFKTGLDPHLSALESPKSNMDLEKSHAAYVMFNSAKSYYDTGALNQAQDEMVRVLKLSPTNTDALSLMSKILTKQCESKNLYCKEASEYEQYLELYKE